MLGKIFGSKKKKAKGFQDFPDDASFLMTCEMLHPGELRKGESRVGYVHDVKNLEEHMQACRISIPMLGEDPLIITTGSKLNVTKRLKPPIEKGDFVLWSIHSHMDGARVMNETGDPRGDFVGVISAKIGRRLDLNKKKFDVLVNYMK